MDILNNIDTLQKAVIEEEQKKQLENKNEPKYKFDRLRMYFGKDYTINGIDISIPTIGDILQVGEADFYSALSPFLNNPTSIRVFLYEALHKDWTKTKEIESFYILLKITKNIDPLKLIFKTVDFGDFELVPAKKNADDEDFNTLALFSPSQNILIYEDEFLEIMEYVREMMNVHPKIEKAKGRNTKLSMIQEDKMKALQKKDNENTSTLLPLVSACINHPGFKYKLDELKDVNICLFMDCVNRIQRYEQSVGAIHGAFSGFVSAKDLPQNLMNLMSDI